MFGKNADVLRGIAVIYVSAAGQHDRTHATSHGFACLRRKVDPRGAPCAPLPSVPCGQWRCSYFDTDFLNMRSIFSLICSIACEFC